MDERVIKAGDVVRWYNGRLLYIHGAGLYYWYATWVDSGESISIPHSEDPQLYELANEEVESAAQEACTTDCLAYCQGICPYLVNRKALCPRVKALLVDLEG